MKRSAVKRALSITLLIAMLIMLGCGNTTNSGSSGKQSAGNATQGKNSAESDSKQNDKTIVTLKYLTINDKYASETYNEVWTKVNEMLEKDIHAHMEIEFLGAADSYDKLKLRYASNSKDFDCSFGTSSFYANLARNNAYAELTTEMLQENMPKSYEMIPQSSWEQMKVNGSIYGVPYNTPKFISDVVLVRGDLIEKYKLQEVTDEASLYKYIQTIAENEKGMEAVSAKEMFRLLGAKYGQRAITGIGSSIVHSITDLEGKIVKYYETPEYLDCAKKARELAVMGAWAPDAISNTKTQEDAFQAGNIASYIENFGGAEKHAFKVSMEHPEWNIKLCDALPESPKMFSTALGNMTNFNRNSNNMELTMQAVERFLSYKEYHDLIQCGIEGKNWKDAGENKLIDLDPQLPEEQRYKGYYYATWNWINGEFERFEGERYPGYDEIYKNCESKKAIGKLDAFVFDTSNVQAELAAISDVISQYANPITFGMVEDVEKAVSDLNAALKNAGLDKVYEECQKQVGEFLGNK